MNSSFHQELTGHYVAAGTSAHDVDLDARRVARAVFVRDTTRVLYEADTKFGIDPVDADSLALLVDAAVEHLARISTDVSQRSVVAATTDTEGGSA